MYIWPVFCNNYMQNTVIFTYSSMFASEQESILLCSVIQDVEHASRLCVYDECTADNDITTTSSYADVVYHVVRCLPSTVTTRLAALQSSSCRSASRVVEAHDHRLRRRQVHDGGSGGGSAGRRRSSHASDSSSTTDTPRLYDH